jgi:hypothetical protein
MMQPSRRETGHAVCVQVFRVGATSFSPAARLRLRQLLHNLTLRHHAGRLRARPRPGAAESVHEDTP